MKTAQLVRSLLAGTAGLVLIIGLFLLTGVSFDSIEKLAAKLDATAFAGIVVCSFLYVALGAIKWRLIADLPTPRPFFYAYYTAQAMLIGQFLPPPVAIAVSRAAVMKRHQNTILKKGFLNAVYDMGSDFLIALLLVPPSLLQLRYGFGFAIWFAIGCATLLAATSFLALAPRLVPAKWLRKTGLHEERKRGLLGSRLVSIMMLLSAMRFALVVARLALGAVAVGIAVPLAVVAYAAPPSTMSSLMMFTPANLGIAEWSWAWLLTLWGVPAATGALYGVSFRILVFAAQLMVSGIVYCIYAGYFRRAWPYKGV